MIVFNGWELWACILLSLFLQILLTVAGTFRRLASRRWFVKILWLAYMLADFVAVLGLGLILSRQSFLYHQCLLDTSCYKDDILMYWATLFLVHLGGPDTITAFATVDNELWRRDLFSLSSRCITVAYAIYESVQTSRKVSLPVLLMFLYGLIKCIERTCALYHGSANGFRKSMLSKNYLQVKILISTNTVALSKLEVLQYAFEYFKVFKGLVVDLSLSIQERYQSREFFLQRSKEDAFRLVEVELNYLYDVLFTKIPVLHHKLGLCCRILSFIAVISSFVLFYFDFVVSPLAPSENVSLKFHKIDKVVSCILFFGAIVLEVIAFYMLLFNDWTVVKLRPLSDAHSNNQSWKDKFLDPILFVNNTRSAFYHYCLDLFGDRDHQISKSEFNDSRWTNSLSAFNLILHCLHRCSEGREKNHTYFGLLWFVNGLLYAKPQPLTNHIADFIFEELKRKSKIAGSLDVAKQICHSKGEWVLNELEDCGTFLPYVNDYDYDDILLMWHIATELCFNDSQNQETHNDQRDTAKQLSDYMLYLMVLKPDMMSGVSSNGEIKFGETCTEVIKFLETKLPELKKRDSKEEKEVFQRQACATILCHETEVDLVTVGTDGPIFFTASVLAKELNNIPSQRKWLIISKLWVELLSYAANHVRSSAHAEQLSKGGELITVVWLLMAHFGLGDKYKINRGKEA